MGLDMYATIQTNEEEPSAIEEFGWRKHAKLHEFMENLFRQEGGTGDFNCVPLKLSISDLQELRKQIVNDDLPVSEGGCFFGHEYQDEKAENSKEYDLSFCTKAIEQLLTNPDDISVVYDSWW